MQTQKLFSIDLVLESPQTDDIGELDFAISHEAMTRYLAKHGADGMLKLRGEAEIALERIERNYMPSECDHNWIDATNEVVSERLTARNAGNLRA